MKSDNIDFPLELTLDEFCCLLGTIDRTIKSDLRGTPKEFILTLKSTRSKLYKVVKAIENEKK